MEQKCFWINWLVTLTNIGLLLLWSLPLAPFTTPGMRANEAVIVFFPVLFVRWLALATLLYQNTVLWSVRLQLNAQWSAVSNVAVLLHDLRSHQPQRHQPVALGL